MTDDDLADDDFEDTSAVGGTIDYERLARLAYEASVESATAVRVPAPWSTLSPAVQEAWKRAAVVLTEKVASSCAELAEQHDQPDAAHAIREAYSIFWEPGWTSPGPL